MTDHLAAEPATDGDAHFRNFQRHNLGHAAEHFATTVTGPPTFGWRLRSISAPVAGPDGERWLRVVSEEPQWAKGNGWTGNTDANVIIGLAKPQVLDMYEWPEGDWRHQRAELMTRLDGQPPAATDVLRSTMDAPDEWWRSLRRALDVTAATPTDRVHADQDRVTERIRARFGEDVDTTVTEWSTAHADVHWSNLMLPFGLLDWELWGRAPAGLDAATLLSYSLLVPDVAARVHDVFTDVLDTRTGRLAQLYVAARLLQRHDLGDHPELAQPLREHADHILKMID